MPKKTKLSKSSLHWFIRSRPYVLLAELRRRFDLDGSDEVHAIETPVGTTYVGLPERAARLIADLVREKRIGLECTAEVQARLAIGVYAYDLLKAPIGLQRSNPFMRPPGPGRPNGAAPGEAPEDEMPDELDDAAEAAEIGAPGSSAPTGAVDPTGAPTPPPSPDRDRPGDRPRFERPLGPRGDRRQGDRRQGDRRDFGRGRIGEPPAGTERRPDGGSDRRPGGRPDLPRRDRPGRPDLPQPRSDRSGPGSPGRRGDARRGPDRPGTRSERPS